MGRWSLRSFFRHLRNIRRKNHRTGLLRGRLSLLLCFAFVLTCGEALGVDLTGTSVPAIPDSACAGTRAATTLNCTANEFTISAVFSASPGTAPFCIAGQPFQFLVDLELSGSNTNRYDPVFYAGQTGNSPTANNAASFCSVAAFPPALATLPGSPWADLDTVNTCSDYSGGGISTVRVNQIKVVCQGDPTTGALMVPYVLSYEPKKQGSTDTPKCANTTPATYPVPSSAKCVAGTSTVSGTVKVFSGAYVKVTKQTVPSRESTTPFTFTASGPGGSTVMAMRSDGTYVSAPPTAVSLRNNEWAQFLINATATPQPLTIAETAGTEWDTTAACTNVTGNPNPTYDTASRTITANLNGTNSAANCIVTNTKRARMTLVKNVAGRAALADEFTVSAAGGGTVTGTTTATTSGSNTVSTTFYSTPGQVLTLTDRRSGGGILTDYDTRLTCTNVYGDAEATTSLPSNEVRDTFSFTPRPGDDITCTFTNTPKAKLTKAFSPGTIGMGGEATLTFTITNPGTAPVKVGNIAFTDTFPANMVIAPNPGVVNTCGGSYVTPNPGDTSFMVDALNAQPGNSTCTISVKVTGLLPLSYQNGSANITSLSAAVLNEASTQTLAVEQGGLTKAFSPATIDQGGTSTLTFTLTNSSSKPAQTGINFTDTLPSNVFVAATPAISTTCPSGAGVISALPGSNIISVSGASIADAMPSCIIAVNVTSAVPGGPYDNTSGSISGIAHTTNNVSTSSLTVRAKPVLTKAFSPSSIVQGQVATLTFTIANPAGAPARTGLTFTDTFPPNLLIDATPAVVSNCGGTPTVTATPGTGVFAIAGTGVNAAPGPSSCTISVTVTSTVPLLGYVNGATNMTAMPGVLLNGVTDQSLNVLSLPNLAILKSAQVVSDPVNGGVSPKRIPGAEMQYTLSITNFGGASADVDSVKIVDHIPDNTSLVVSGTPVGFTNGSPACNLTFTWGGLASLVDDVEFSTDGTDYANYVPTPGSNGTDPAVRYLRLNPKGTFVGSTGPGNDPTCSFTFSVIIN